eukprot:185771_1
MACKNTTFICDAPSCNTDSYRSLHIYYLIGALCTLCGTLFVILTYLFSPSLRTHPSVMIFGRSIFDFGFGLSFIALYFVAKQDLSELVCTKSVCAIMGPFNLFVFLCSQGYFLCMSIDLYLSISNPFLNAALYTHVMHISIISISALSIVVVTELWDFKYNRELQYCSITPMHHYKQWNTYNWIFIFAPTLICMISSFVITCYAFSRLTKGLPNTFYIRIKALRDTLVYSVSFTIYFFIIGFTYFVTWHQHKDVGISIQHDSFGYKFHALSASLLGVIDFIVWISRKCNRNYLSDIDFLSAKHWRQLTSSFDHRPSSTSTLDLELYQRSPSKITSNENTPNSYRRGHQSHSRFHKKTKSSAHPALPDRVFQNLSLTDSENECDEDGEPDTSKDPNKKRRKQKASFCKRLCSKFGIKQKTNSSMINNALRREVLAYTTDGIAQSVLKAHKLPNKAEQFTDIRASYFPTHLKDCNGLAIQQFKICIKHNITLLSRQSKVSMIDDRFCCCFIMDNNRISISPNKMSDVYYGVRATEHSSLITVSSVTVQANKPRERLFTDYAPLVFRYIRNRIVGISDTDYIASIIPSNAEDQLQVLDVKYGEGKSGAFFYYTWDSKFIVKTVSKTEVKHMLSVLQNYVKHMEHNRNTIISRIVGIHSCRFYTIVKHFVVMENVFLGDLKPNEMYDLKGSWEGRYTKYGVYAGKVMKDLDLKRYMILNEQKRTKILQQLDMDTQFLANNNIMDYSLLLGIYYMKITYNDDSADDSKYNDCFEDEGDIYGGVRSSLIEGPGIYYFGIIDAIQKYTFRKRLETWFRRWIQRKNVKGISCVHPELYKKRFMNYMKSIIISSEEYYKQLHLSKKRFGDEHVLIYPPRKVLNKNMRIMREKRTMSIITINNDTPPRILPHTPDRRIEHNEMDEDVVNDIHSSYLSSEYAKRLASTLADQNKTK